MVKEHSVKVWVKLVNLMRENSFFVYDAGAALELIDDGRLLVTDGQVFGIQKNLEAMAGDKSQALKTKMKEKIPGKPEKPRYPDPDECCGENCLDCVYILHQNKLDDYEKWCLINGSESDSDDDWYQDDG
jgi:hypothetical protein